MATRLDGILSGFTKLTKKLERFIGDSDKAVRECRINIQKIDVELEDHEHARNKASRVLANVQKLIED